MKKQERRRLAAEEKREHCVSVRMNEAELARLDAERGRFHRGEWLRRTWSLTQPKPPVPEVNRQAWAELARLAGNLNQAMKAFHEGRLRGVDPSVLEELFAQVHGLRRALIGAEGQVVQAPQSEEVEDEGEC